MPVQRGTTWGRPSIDLATTVTARGRVVRRQCPTCGQPFEVRQAHAADKKRCDNCIANGIQKCVGCDSIFKGAIFKGAATTPKGTPKRLCEQCRVGRTVKPTDRFVRLQCRGVKLFESFEHAKRCRGTWYGYRSTAQQREKREGSSVRLWDNSYVCIACSGLPFLKRRVDALLTKMRDRGMKPPRVRTLDQALELLRAEGALNVSDAGRLRRISPQERLEVSLSPKRPRTLQHRWAIRAAKWTGTRAGRPAASLCEWCGQLVLDGGSRLPTTHHNSCRFERRRTPEYQAWWQQRLELRRDGVSIDRVDKIIGAFPPLPPERKRPGRQPDRAIVTRNLGWAIEYLLGPTGDTMRYGVKVRNGAGPKEYVAQVQIKGLALRDHVSEATVSRAIAETIDLLPDPAVVSVSKSFASLIADLRLADQLRRGA